MHVHGLAQRWLVDQTCRHIYNRAMLHDALTAHVVSDGSIGPSQVRSFQVAPPCPSHCLCPANFSLSLTSFPLHPPKHSTLTYLLSYSTFVMWPPCLPLPPSLSIHPPTLLSPPPTHCPVLHPASDLPHVLVLPSPYSPCASIYFPAPSCPSYSLLRHLSPASLDAPPLSSCSSGPSSDLCPRMGSCSKRVKRTMGSTCFTSARWS